MALDDIVAAAKRAASLTRQLLVYSGRATAVSRPTQLLEHLKELTHLLEANISKNVHLRLDVPDDLPVIAADVAQLQQVIMNVILNGAEAIGMEGGEVHVTAAVVELSDSDLGRLVSLSARPGPHLMVQSRDTGHGIDEATLEKIFDPFYTTKGQGRGLGLASVVGIMQAHRGALAVSSTPGRGTIFRLYFPVAGNLVEEAQSARKDRAYGYGAVLVIDDEKSVRVALARALTVCGYDALLAEGGREGLAILTTRPQGIRGVILDLTMPDMSGGETFLELRRMRGDLPVVLLSGSNQTNEVADMLRHDHVRFMTKPFTLDVLRGELAEAFR